MALKNFYFNYLNYFCDQPNLSIDSNESVIKAKSSLKTRHPCSMHYRERRSHARSVHPTEDTSSLGLVRVKQDEEADTRIIAKYVGTKREAP